MGREAVRAAEATAIPERVMACLPGRLTAALRALPSGAHTEELRLSRGAGSCLCRGGRVELLGVTLTQSDIDGIVNALCGGSMYAHADTLRQGYVTLEGGIRVGICGRMRTDGGRILGVSEISSLVFRFPLYVALPTDAICRALTLTHPGRGVLIYSPPGVGKTTLLRALIRALAAPPYRLRLAVVDTREELSACGTDVVLGTDWLSGYPRGVGIEIATRTLSPHLIVCDEIGEAAEAEAICVACNAGVPLVASAHGANAADLLRRRGLRMLHENRVFGSYVGLSRTPGGVLSQRVTPASMVCGSG